MWWFCKSGIGQGSTRWSFRSVWPWRGARWAGLEGSSLTPSGDGGRMCTESPWAASLAWVQGCLSAYMQLRVPRARVSGTKQRLRVISWPILKSHIGQVTSVSHQPTYMQGRGPRDSMEWVLKNFQPCVRSSTVEAVWRFLSKLATEFLYDPAILLLGIYPRELKTSVETKPWTWILFTVAKRLNNPNAHQQLSE